MTHRGSYLRGLFAAGVLILPGLLGPAQAQLQKLDIVAVADAGSGIDQTARAVQAALEAEKLASNVQVENKSGGSGAVGLSYFLSSKKGGEAVLVAGKAHTMGTEVNKAPVRFNQVTPLARLVGEYEVVVVSEKSDIKTLADLVAKIKADPTGVSWGAGSVGTVDHVTAGSLMRAAGADPRNTNYIAHSGGGGEVVAATLGGHVTVGLSGYGEFKSLIASGQLRALGISAPERLPGVDIPTFKEQGLDVEIVNWRGLFAPADISPQDLAKLSDALSKMVASESWKKTLGRYGWLDLYLNHDEFAKFVDSDLGTSRTVLTDIGLIK
jgi:putative tricarboxylic transport membrane protein